jgi:hypothetical protein
MRHEAPYIGRNLSASDIGSGAIVRATDGGAVGPHDAFAGGKSGAVKVLGDLGFTVEPRRPAASG